MSQVLKTQIIIMFLETTNMKMNYSNVFVSYLDGKI